MPGRIKLRKTPVTYITGGWQAYEGPGLLTAIVADYNASSSGCVLTAYDTTSGSLTAPQLYTVTTDTDFGTTVPVTVFTDGDLVAGTSTANVKVGMPFARGFFLNKTGDTTHQVDVTLFIKPLIRKSVNIRTAGSAGSAVGVASVFDGPGLLHGLRIRCDTLTPSTTDFLVKDSPVIAPAAGTGSGNTILTKTNYGFAAEAVRPVVTLTGTDEGTTGAVTTAATGAYANTGIHFTTGLNVSVQQANPQDAAYQIDFLIEA